MHNFYARSYKNEYGNSETKEKCIDMIDYFSNLKIRPFLTF